MNKIKNYVATHMHGVYALGYLLIYLLWFTYLEQTVTSHYTVIHMGIDNYIPFVEVFIIPYLLWFGYVAFAFLFLFFTDKADFLKACAFLFTGMTVFLIVSTLWPNGHHLRPRVMPRDNIFTQLVAALYKTDTSTNIWPSIHVYNSLGAHIALVRSKHFSGHKWACTASFLLAVSIILSTVFLKQHSMFDVLTAFVMALVMYGVVYRYNAAAYVKHPIKLLHRKRRISL